MNKYVKWSIVGVVVLGLTGLGIRTFVPRENEDLKQNVPGKGDKKGQQGKALNVRAVVLGEQSLTDGIYVSGSLVPDEEVSLSFETSGKITGIFFKEGAHVAQGQLLAKINDAPLQAELRKKQAQLKLMQDRLYRAKALLKDLAELNQELADMVVAADEERALPEWFLLELVRDLPRLAANH